MEWLKDMNKVALLSAGTGGKVPDNEANVIAAYCCLMYHPDSPLQKTKDRKERKLKALNACGADESVAEKIASMSYEFMFVSGKWFAEYGSDWMDLYVTLCLKIDQLHEILRQPIVLTDMTADDRAKTVKYNCDAAEEIGKLISKKEEIEKKLFADNKDTKEEARRILAGSLSPESMAGMNI